MSKVSKMMFRITMCQLPLTLWAFKHERTYLLKIFIWEKNFRWVFYGADWTFGSIIDRSIGHIGPKSNFEISKIGKICQFLKNFLSKTCTPYISLKFFKKFSVLENVLKWYQNNFKVNMDSRIFTSVFLLMTVLINPLI